MTLPPALPPAQGDAARPVQGFMDAVAYGYLQAILLFGVLAAGLYACFRLTLPFLTPVVTALILAILFAPVHRQIERRLKASSLTAGISVTVIAAMLLVPIAFLFAGLLRDAATGAAMVRAGIEDGFIARTLGAYPKAAAAAQWMLERTDVQGLIATAASRLTDMSAALVRVSAVQAVGVVLTFYLLFYFLRDRKAALLAVRGFLPFTVEEASMIFDRVVDTVRATIYGTVVTGALQGILGGIIFAVAGLPAPLLWGLVIALVAILPVLGTVLVWLPAVAFVALDGDWLRAAVIAFAFLAIGVFDTFLYPALVGDRLRLHTGVTFIAVIGGLIVFGPAGFILGPLAVAMTLATKDILRERLKNRPE